MELSFGIIRADIIMAKQAIKVYKENPKLKDVKNMCAYHIQQAVEKLIKIQIYKSGMQYDNSAMYTHNISALINYAHSKGIKVYIPEFVNDNAAIITKWEAGCRYDLHFSIRVDTLEKYIAVVQQWYHDVNKKLK